MTETVLVTGAAGFVGRHLVPALEANGFDVRVHNRADGDLAEAPPKSGPVTHVVHLAGRTFVPESWTDPVAFYRDNVAGTASVLNFCRRTGASLVYVSSYVYGVPQQLPVAETHPLQAQNPYAHSKILAEDAVRFFMSHAAVAATILRPFNLYGPGQDERFLVPSMLRQAIDPAADAIVVRDLDPRRDFLYVTDFIDLIVAVLAQVPGGLYNAGSGRSTSIGELVDAINDACGIGPVPKPVRVTGERRPHEIPDVVADISRAIAELNWRPRVQLPDGLRETVAWMTRRSSAV